MCSCTCEYRRKLIYWEENTTPNRTYVELLEFLKPLLKKINNELTISKTTLSFYKRKKTSAPDDRTSSHIIGLVGIAFISSIFGLLLIVDCINFLQFAFGCSKLATLRKFNSITNKGANN